MSYIGRNKFFHLSNKKIMLNDIDIRQVLFLDAECVSGKPDFSDLSEDFQTLWKHKAQGLSRQEEPLTDEEAAASYTERAGIYAEFGKIVCISVGVVTQNPETKELQLRLKSYASDDEKALLEEFAQLLTKHYHDPRKHFLCGHNIKEFDVPYICRRMVVHQIPFPPLLEITGKKPWEVAYLLDTMELWKFGDRKSFSSLKLLAALLDFPSPKDDIDGSQVGRVYWEEQDLPRISFYCEKDVLATTQLFLRYRREPILLEEQVVHVRESS